LILNSDLFLTDNFKIKKEPFFGKFPIFKLFLSSISALIVILPALASTLLLVEPRTPPFIGWWIFHPNQEYHFIFKILSSFVTLFCLMSLMASTLPASVYGPFLKIFIFLNHMKEIRKVSKIRNEKDNLKTALFMYRQVQLLVSIFNECYQWIYFTWFFLTAYLMMTVNLYAFVRFHSTISIVGSLFSGIVSLEGFAFIFILNTVAGKMYHTSRQMPKLWLTEIRAQKDSSLIRKSIRSCAGIKIRIGSVNFLDRLTPFVTCGLCLKITLRLLITTHK
jgi:hypothetical protein